LDHHHQQNENQQARPGHHHALVAVGRRLNEQARRSERDHVVPDQKQGR